MKSVILENVHDEDTVRLGYLSGMGHDMLWSKCVVFITTDRAASSAGLARLKLKGFFRTSAYGRKPGVVYNPATAFDVVSTGINENGIPTPLSMADLGTGWEDYGLLLGAMGMLKLNNNAFVTKDNTIASHYVPVGKYDDGEVKLYDAVKLLDLIKGVGMRIIDNISITIRDADTLKNAKEPVEDCLFVDWRYSSDNALVACMKQEHRKYIHAFMYAFHDITCGDIGMHDKMAGYVPGNAPIV